MLPVVVEVFDVGDRGDAFLSLPLQYPHSLSL